jgi:hypothetical protein
MYEDEDYVLRLVRRIAAAIARVAGLNRQEAHVQALAAADQVWSQLLALPDISDGIDSHILAGVIGDPARIRLAQQLLCEQARAFDGTGDERAAAERYRRALELLLEAHVRAPADGDAAEIAALRVLVPYASLAPRYRAHLPSEA